MLFNSLTFLIFLPIVFGVYWFALARSVKAQNVWLLLASYIFYGWWDWRFMGLIAFTSAVSYLTGLKCEKGREHRKCWLVVSLVLNLAILGFFKYCNFFLESTASLLQMFGMKANLPVLQVILPVGISFYTFQALSYTIDVYREKICPVRDWVAFFTFVSFFPQLVAGPIERASNLLPQFTRSRQFDCDKALHGVCLIVYGLFKKMVVADTLALYVDQAFAHPALYNSTACVLGAIFFSFQIYCDFSGYSDCARGLARLFGFELMLNFDRPYLSKSFGEFWHRWHISLSSWFKDYVYIPLGGNRVPFHRLIVNTWIVFVLSGLWHGASWTFVAWGALHAVFLTGGILRKRYWPSLKLPSVLSVVLVDLGVFGAWMLFRARTFADLISYLRRIADCEFLGSMMAICAGQGPMLLLFCFISISLLLLSYVVPRDCVFRTTKACVVYILIVSLVTIFFAVPSGGEFIYFQF